MNRDLARREDGFSLMELMVAMVTGGIILTALMTIFLNGIQSTTNTQDRLDSQQRGRLTMDRVTTLLSSEVCLDAATPPIVPVVSTSSSVTFYGDLQGASNTPKKYTLTWDASAKTLTEYSYNGTGVLPAKITWPASPSTTRQLATNVWPARNDTNTADLPIFAYYRFESDGTVNPANPIAAGSGIAATDSDDVVEVIANFRVLPSAATASSNPRSTSITGSALVGSADPASPSAGPNCQ
jgi:prepilin-type N-terminal cleavage/methylation domain-containing protein